MVNPYKTSPDHPYHLSIGCLLYDSENKIVSLKYILDKQGEIYTLMRESIEPNESPEQALARGLIEEMGAEGEIITYIGSITANDVWFKERDQPTMVEKTTVYFLARLKTIDESKRLIDDDESSSEIMFIEPSKLIVLMQQQFENTGRQDLNESTIIQKALQYFPK